MTGVPHDDDSPTVAEALEALNRTVETEGVEATIHDDGSEMTPMLVVEFDRTTKRVDVLRTLFHADGPVEVDAVHNHRAVVREADR
jgi:hypothetical protein